MKLIAPFFFLILFSCGTESDDASLISEDNLEKQRQTLLAMEEKRKPGDEGEIDDQGLRQGLWITYGKDDAAMGYPDEAKIHEGRYLDNFKEGFWTYYSVDNKIDSVIYYKNGMPSEEPINKVDALGKKSGYWIVYGEDMPKSGYRKDAIVEEGTYESGAKTDFWIYYDKNGDVDSVRNYAANMRSGKYAFNLTDANGYKQGYWCIYGKDFPARGYPDVAKLEEGVYDYSRKTGRWIYYAPDQTTDSVVRFVNGNPLSAVY